jgi:hypothetical protein
MAIQPSPWKTASVTLATHGQTREKIIELVGHILTGAQCHTCGRLVRFEAVFGGDPSPELAKQGVTSITVA